MSGGNWDNILLRCGDGVSMSSSNAGYVSW